MDGDSFEIEITDLRGDPVAAPAPADGVPQPAGSSPEDEPGTAAPRRGNSPLARRAGRRARLLGSASAATVLTVALVVVLLGSPVARGPFNSLFPTPTATELGADTFQLVNDVPWGTLTADGHAIARTRLGGQPALFRLDGGTHQLVFVAPPFPALRCQVSVPAAAADTCPLARDTQQLYLVPQPPRLEGLRVLDLRASVDNLPLDSHAQLIAATRALFASAQQQTVVRPGEHYLGGDQRMRVARSVLQATQAMELDPNLNSGVSFNGETCNMICSLPAPAAIPGGWALMATATLSWRFAAPDGTLVAETAPQTHDGAQMSVMPIMLTATWQSAWQVSFATGSGGLFGLSGGPDAPLAVTAQILCGAAQFDAASRITPSTEYGSIGWSGIAPNAADGCVVVNQATNPEDQLVGQPEYWLYRFGVLLAASPLAHQLNPDLPLADSFELALAQHAAAASMPPQFTSNSGG